MTILTVLDHPLEVSKNKKVKETKRKEREQETAQKNGRKKQKEAQQIKAPKFSEFIQESTQPKEPG